MAYDSYETTSEHSEDHIVVREMHFTHLQPNAVTAPMSAAITGERDVEAQSWVYPRPEVYSVSTIDMANGNTPYIIQQPMQPQAHMHGHPDQTRGLLTPVQNMHIAGH